MKRASCTSTVIRFVFLIPILKFSNFFFKFQSHILPNFVGVPSFPLVTVGEPGAGKTTCAIIGVLSRVDLTKNFPQVIFLSNSTDAAQSNAKFAASIAKFIPELDICSVIEQKKGNIIYLLSSNDGSFGFRNAT